MNAYSGCALLRNLRIQSYVAHLENLGQEGEEGDGTPFGEKEAENSKNWKGYDHDKLMKFVEKNKEWKQEEYPSFSHTFD